MPKSQNIPDIYHSDIIGTIKQKRSSSDPKRTDFSPSILNFGSLIVTLSRFFGFCFGVENAIDIAYCALADHPGKRVFLLSEMIHNPAVNANLTKCGIKFLFDELGKVHIPITDLNPNDIVIIPAFGTSAELQSELHQRGIDVRSYDATCPFVKKVWKRAEIIGHKGYTVIIHGKQTHAETRATFSHAALVTPTLIIRNYEDACFLANVILTTATTNQFWARFEGCTSKGFDPSKHLHKIGVVNQTTMLASETKRISDVLKEAVCKRNSGTKTHESFADTKDTLCYATAENQKATQSLIKFGADMALVVGGYNSSNTSHIAKMCDLSLPTYYVKDEGEILNNQQIRHFALASQSRVVTKGWLDNLSSPTRIAITAGASCPDKTIEDVLTRVISLFPSSTTLEVAIRTFCK